MATIVHAVIGYILLTLVVRMLTRRPGAQMTLFEFVLVFLMGGVIILSTVGNDRSVTNCTCAVLTVGCMHRFVSGLKLRYPKFGMWVDGTPLVLGDQSYALTTSPNSSGLEQVLDSSGKNITLTISSGDLGGTITTRDMSIPTLLNQLDTLANHFATAINAAQAQGYNQDVPPTLGTNMFTVPATVAGSAATITLATTDPSAIAASSDGSSGSNGNVANLSAVATTKLASGATPTGTSANLVYQVGTLTSNASSQSTAISISLTQLTQQQSSVSGVSIDEESTNLIQYQQAYQAAAKVVSTIQTLFDSTLSMVGG